MKKRRTLIISLLLIASMALGLGYAAVTRELSIKGGAELAITEDKFAVEFINTESDKPVATFSEDSAGTLTSWEANGNVAKFGLAGMEHEGESVTILYKIQNKTGDLYGKLNTVEAGVGLVYLGTGTSTPGNFDDYFTMSAKVYKADSTGAKGAEWTDSDILNPTATETTDNSNIAYVEVTLALKTELSTRITLSGATVSVTWDGLNSVELAALS